MKILRPEPIPTVKRPEAPNYPEPGCRGYMTERARMAHIRAAAMQPDRAGRVARRKRTLHSTHWTLPARRAHMMVRPARRRMFVAQAWALALACIGVIIVDNGPSFRPTVIVPGDVA